MDKTQIVFQAGDDVDVEREIHPEMFALGQWYWVKNTDRNIKEDEPKEWLGCITHIGSNYVYIKQPDYDSSGIEYGIKTKIQRYGQRIHFKNAVEMLRRPENDQEAVAEVTNGYVKKANQFMNEIQEITKRIGVRQDNMIQGDAAVSSGTGLAVFSGNVDIHQYKNDLIEAKDVALPALFKELNNAHKGVAQWMAAPALAMSTAMKHMQEDIKVIDDRIFNVTLYAGIEEHAVQCKDGAPADISEKLHIMQRKLFMDEECLLNYSAGGMEFEHIGDFDQWMSQEQNFTRLLPFPRTIIAMQVRRNMKERGYEGFAEYIQMMEISKQDAYTYLYVRNGEQLHRVSLFNFEFGDLIFPDRADFDPSEEMHIKFSSSMSVDGLVKKSVHEQHLADAEHYLTLVEQEKATQGESYSSFYDRNYDKYRDALNRADNTKTPFNSDSVYFDDAKEWLGKIYTKYNRISLIVQGIFDRSPMLSPHLQVQTWNPESFNRSIKLVYDSENALYADTKPDFEAYRKRCNALANAESQFVGQLDYWMRKCAEKENNRTRYDRHSTNYVAYKPYGNPGMPTICKSDKLTKNKATFKWNREKLTKSWYNNVSIVGCSITIPLNELFNVSAYQLGDYKQFFADPRTRQEYLKWAPLLLAAEDYANGRHVDETGEDRYRNGNKYYYR